MLRACRGESVDRPPVWLMRQAGRYLPEYRAVRAKYSFLEMCQTPDAAVEVSLQPIDLLGSEACILFSDIFVPILGLGIDVDFRPGPHVDPPLRSQADVDALAKPDIREAVPYVFDILRQLRREVDSRGVPLLGFAGAPFTLAAYLVEGSGSSHFAALKTLLHREPKVLRSLLDRLVELTVDYLNAQIEAGAQVVQLFDTWAGLLDAAEYREWVLPTHRAIASRVNRAAAPLILYVNNGSHLLDSMLDSGADVMSLDWRVDLADAARRVGSRASIQGNLDPCGLHAPGAEIAKRVRDMAEAGRAARGHILNLGHGCLPGTPVEGVRAFIEAARALSAD